MGELIRLSDHRPRRAPEFAGAVFSFDLASPHTYLAAERVDRLFGCVQWVPVITDLPIVQTFDSDTEHRAAALRLPLIWPEREIARSTAAARVAGYAASNGRGAEFVLAASRLTFCGGFDLDDPEILAEACAAANLPLEECLEAARAYARDDEMRAAGNALIARGAYCLPTLHVGRMMFCGEERIAEAAAAARSVASQS